MRIIIAAALLMLLMFSACISGSGAEERCLCPNYSSEWTVLSDTSTSIPDFFFQPRVAVKRMIICDHGVYFFFSTKEKGRHRYTCLAYPKPTEEIYYKYFEKDSLTTGTGGGDPHSGPQKLLNDYTQFKHRVQALLDMRAGEPNMICFDRHHMRRPTLSFSNPLAFTLKRRRIEFHGLLDVYYQ